MNPADAEKWDRWADRKIARALDKRDDRLIDAVAQHVERVRAEALHGDAKLVVRIARLEASLAGRETMEVPR